MSEPLLTRSRAGTVLFHSPPRHTMERQGGGATVTSESEAPMQLAPRALARVAVIAGVLGALSTAPLSPVLQSIALLVFMSAGVGSAALCWSDLPGGAMVAGVIGLSVAAVMGTATQMASFGIWYPVQSCLVMSSIVATAGLIRLWALRKTGARAQEIPVIATETVSETDASATAQADAPRLVGTKVNLTPYLGPMLLLVAFGIWLLALPMLRSDPVDEYGLLATPAGMLLIIATSAAITGFVVAIMSRRTVTAGVAILAVILFERVTVSLITEVPIYSWTYKHIGVVDYILEYGSLYAPSVDIYRQWPGFFAGMAWFSSITGLDVVDSAHWFAPVVDALTVTVVAALALCFGLTLRVALIAAMLAQVVNWIGQDYYSPQAIALVMAIAILALLASSKQFNIAGYLSVPIFAVFVATHQLTPVWVCALAVALALFGQLRPWWLPALYLLVVAVYVPPRLPFIQQYGWFTGFNPLENSRPAETTGSNPSGDNAVLAGTSDGRRFTTFVEQGLSVSLWLLAAICFAAAWHRNAGRWAAAIIAFSSLVLLFGQNYGGEAILRVYLYSLAGCAVLIAPLLASLLTREYRRLRILPVTAAWLVLIGFAAAGMQGYYGAWSYLTVTGTQVEQARWLSETNPAGTVITSPAGPAGWPGRASADYVRHALVDPWYDVEYSARQEFPLTTATIPEALKRLESDAQSIRRPLYIVMPRKAWVYNDYMRFFEPGALDSLVGQLDGRPGWITVIHDADTQVFKYSIGD